TVLATLASVALARRSGTWVRALDTFFMSPLILPMLAFGLAALMYFTFMGFRPSLALIAIGHVVVVAPLALRTTSASMSQLDPALLETSASLGASWLYTFRRVTLPVIAPGIAAGAFLAFVASLDNVPVSLFLSGPQSDMLPIRMWGMMESMRSEEHTSELQSRGHLVCRLLLEKKQSADLQRLPEPPRDNRA